MGVKRRGGGAKGASHHIISKSVFSAVFSGFCVIFKGLCAPTLHLGNPQNYCHKGKITPEAHAHHLNQYFELKLLNYLKRSEKAVFGDKISLLNIRKKSLKCMFYNPSKQL